MAPKIMTSKYAGECPGCSRGIRKGDRIAWSRGRGARHVDCAAPSRESRPQMWSEGKLIDVPECTRKCDCGATMTWSSLGFPQCRPCIEAKRLGVGMARRTAGGHGA
jgi:hypothetical protein